MSVGVAFANRVREQLWRYYPQALELVAPSLRP
jgi:hypothetical protein